jgi:N-acetylmuramoyl-L-alanine amidase
MTRSSSTFLLGCLLLAASALVGCAPRGSVLGEPVERLGDEIVVCGQLFHTGAQVVLWGDPGGYDAYRTGAHFGPYGEMSWEAGKGPKSSRRYGSRELGPESSLVEEVGGEDWSLGQLQTIVDQFVVHYDACGTSRMCFRVLHDERGLSAHFLLDVDGTIYQTLDLKERAWHATIANDRSVGIEIANIGAYTPTNTGRLRQWYAPDGSGGTRLTIPAARGDGGVRTVGFIGKPARPEPITGVIQGTKLVQYDLTPEQYESLSKLTAALCSIFPKMHCDAPRAADGSVVDHCLTPEEFANFAGVLGHYHVQPNKVDPGPAFQWEMMLEEARRHLRR